MTLFAFNIIEEGSPQMCVQNGWGMRKKVWFHAPRTEIIILLKLEKNSL